MSVATIAGAAILGVGAAAVIVFGIGGNVTVQMGELYVDCSNVTVIQQTETEVVLECTDTSGASTGTRVSLPRASEPFR